MKWIEDLKVGDPVGISNGLFELDDVVVTDIGDNKFISVEIKSTHVLLMFYKTSGNCINRDLYLFEVENEYTSVNIGTVIDLGTIK